MASGALTAGRKLGSWTLVRKLGDGTMGVVYEATNAEGQRAAIKVLKTEHAANPKVTDRFRRESKVLELLTHRNVVRLLGSGEEEGAMYIVLEFVDGESLEQRLKREPKRLDAGDSRQLAIDLLRALEAVHAQGLVHRDVKPANILRGSDGFWKVTDFGLARRESVDESIVVTQQGAVLGTPHYMAPEQCEGIPAEARSDLYAAGATIFHAITGQTLFVRPTFMDVIAAQVKEKPPGVRELVPDAPADLATLVARLVAKSMDDRPATAHDALALIGVDVGLGAKTAEPDAGAAAEDVEKLQASRTMVEPDEVPPPVAPAPAPAAPIPMAPPRKATTGALPIPDPGKARPPTGRIDRPPIDATPRASQSGRFERPLVDAPVRGSQSGRFERGQLDATPRSPSASGIKRAQEDKGGATPRPGSDRLGQAGGVTGGTRRARPTSARLASDLGAPEPAPVEPAPPSQAWRATLVPLAVLVSVIVVYQVLIRAPGVLEAIGVAPTALSGKFPFVVALLAAAVILRYVYVAATESAPANATARTPLARLLARIRYAQLRASDPDGAARALDALGSVGDVGRFHMSAGRFKEAAAAYLAAKKPHLAARAFERAGNRESAREAFLAAGEDTEAARVAFEDRKFSVAGEIFARINMVDEAIVSYKEAAMPAKVADLCEGVGRFAEAALAVLEIVQETGSRLGGSSKALLRRAAELQARAGKPLEAAALFVRAEVLDRAVEQYELGNEPAKGASLATKLGDHARAAALYDKANLPAEAANARAEAFVAKGDHAAAAREFQKVGANGQALEHFERAGAFAEASRCAEAANDIPRAAALASRAQDHHRAATLHEKQGDLAAAAEAYRKQGDKTRAARATERLGDPIKTAEAWLAAGSRNEALRVLTAVPAGSSHRKAALARLGELHADAGRDTEAASAFASALDGAIVDAEVTRRTLVYAEVLARLGQIAKAQAALESLKGSPDAPADLEVRISTLASKSSLPAPRAQAAAPGDRRGGKELVGTEIDRYKLIGFLGEGATAWIYRAEHSFLGRLAALKLLKVHPDENKELVGRFLAEGRAVAALRHPSLIEVYDFGQTADGFLYMALELVSGGSLRDFIAKKEPLPPQQIARIGADTLAGLWAAHKKGIIHRDLKPENILLDDGMRPKVVDFGIAKLLSAHETVAGDYLGTPKYTSPEQALGKTVGPAADQYAFGLIFYELCSGQLPFESATPLGYMTAHAQTPPRPLQEVAPKVPARLAAAIMKCLEKDPAARHPDLEKLQRIFASLAFTP
jgi:serine/threonine-protein kinase